jgi:hypothetical protein
MTWLLKLAQVTFAVLSKGGHISASLFPTKRVVAVEKRSFNRPLERRLH